MHKPRQIVRSAARLNPRIIPEPKLVRTTDRDRWDRFIADSRQGSVFMSRAFLDATFEEYHLLLLEQGDEAVAGAVIAFEGGEIMSSPHPYCPYLGIALAGSHEVRSRHSRSQWVPKVSEAAQAHLG